MKEVITKELKCVQYLTKKYRPQILTFLGVGGLVTAGIAAVRVTPKALEIKKELDRKEHTRFDYLKALAPVYLPSIIMGASSIGCIVGATTIFTKRGAALATAYKLTEGAFMDYKHATEAVVGEKKVNDIYNKIAEEKMAEHPYNEVVVEAKDELWHDSTTGVYFRANENKINAAVNDANGKLLDSNDICLNDVYELMDIPPVHVGDMYGWHYEHEGDDKVSWKKLKPIEAPNGELCHQMVFQGGDFGHGYFYEY